PEYWDGDRKNYDAFKFQVKLYLEGNKDKLDTDDKKILVVLSFLRGGEAEEWARQFVDNAAALTLADPAVTGFGVYTEFMKQLEDAFKPFDKVGDAVDELEKLQMGDRPAADHVTTFNALLARSEIKDDATIIRLFRRSLPFRILKTLMTLDTQPANAAAWKKKAVEIDSNWRRMNDELN
ncbi:hypothetical protein GALMADRAFT_28766, partial [Galerina marginata CBS 339.88]